MADKDKPSVPPSPPAVPHNFVQPDPPREKLHEDVNKSYVHERPFPTTQPPTNRVVPTPPPPLPPKAKK